MSVLDGPQRITELAESQKRVSSFLYLLHIFKTFLKRGFQAEVMNKAKVWYSLNMTEA